MRGKFGRQIIPILQSKNKVAVEAIGFLFTLSVLYFQLPISLCETRIQTHLWACRIVLLLRSMTCCFHANCAFRRFVRHHSKPKKATE
jgi:hypothetical protein